MNSKKESQSDPPVRPAIPYWEDPVYHYLSRQHRSALDAGDDLESVRFDKLMQELADESMSGEFYWELESEAKADRKKRKEEQKQRRKPWSKRSPVVEGAPSINVADLKKRIFNPQVSRENVIKALEALPPAERKTTIAGLPPWLRRKLGQYVKGGRR